ncbi:DUF948 domain-containing protein [Enterococcus columbae]|uniref:General stress protein n=1 Tax=Enterococcus columbae DSM 7374 = ATCC 51263 TaxID=1121865 RepID=S1N5L6_9ENTE|nr:DUF948 domain-containing protein [Enterococcus columbae]EOT44142.1 hypothetical protein OMW_00196 [Enterococcus columbae DSM 7374 = ATCC 51263]EOW84300.1 hypothetical protein I568_00794 [Enterococcus columbae DSM 7374 = ATCC 51263]OJG26142.1 hypothetical protein RR47_GL000940 [Enterococcus columbae DSM 7374 = ATCC 51263]
MNGFEIAALIAAIAFAVLIYFLIRLVGQVNQVVARVGNTIDETNKTIQVVTKDVDILSREVEGLLVKSNELLNDVNQKVATIDPLFTAVADLSQSVIDLNDAGRNLVAHVETLGKSTAQAAVAGKVGKMAIKYIKKNKETTEG